MSDILTRLSQTLEIAALTAELSEARMMERKALEFGARMEAERDRLHAALEAVEAPSVEWRGEWVRRCLCCGQATPPCEPKTRHAPDCIVGLALGGKA